AAEICPVSVPQRKGDPLQVTADEGPRADTTADSLAKLRPAFKRDGGTVTAGNASSINDGAAALLVASGDFVAEQGLQPLARITGYVTGGAAPEWVMMAPVDAVTKLMAREGTKIGDYDLIEINEAFAAQVLACHREEELPMERVNVNGGAISLGHPIGCSGARVLTTLLHALEDRGLSRGAAALCLGGGNAVAMSIEVLS
ncbi:MAG: acetyl-CoA C-acyltransferase, partial [Planctomycetes bacterium]|nr:acetyl-CoA C-acyltransferase [Planctomycetota bacterium]